MASTNVELALVQRFRSLSENYEARPAIARRNTLPALSRFLASKEREIRKLSLEAVYMLSQHPENVELLANEQAITDGIFGIYKEAQYDDPELHELSSNTLDLLCVAMPEADPRRAEVLRRAAERSLLSADSRRSASCGSSSSYRRSMENDSEEGERENSPQTSMEPSAASSGVGNQSMHMVTLEIPALNPRTSTADLDAILEATKGVLSYTVSPSAHQVRILMVGRALAPLQDALNTAGYVTLVVSDDRSTRQNSVGSVQRSYYDDDDDGTNRRRPSYLQSARTFASSLYNAVIVYSGAQGNSLAARVQRQQELEKNQGSKVADRIAKSFANWW